MSIPGNGARTAASFTVASGDTNAAVLDALAAAVNRASAGVAASVETTGTTSRLVLAADRTGTSGAFTVADASGSAVAATGIGTIERAAANAAYTGVEHGGARVRRAPDPRRRHVGARHGHRRTRRRGARPRGRGSRRRLRRGDGRPRGASRTPSRRSRGAPARRRGPPDGARVGGRRARRRRPPDARRDALRGRLLDAHA